ncbi:unnamed protein product [Prunus armeniaca]|uniref:Uncharacterized protein n=1 Tax=Prunus armeniaca TaxID=36596 RepID=A0A6J5VJ52_PRUAR|nr:unnamed protein product [Prunus armeniaca]
MRKRAALWLVLWLAMSVGTWGEDQNAENNDSWTGWARDKLTEGVGLKGGEAGSKSSERANKAAFVQKFLEGAIYSLEKHQTAKAEELMKGAMEYLYHDNTIKDKAAKLEEFMKEAIKYLEQDMVEKAENVVKGAARYLKGDDKDNDEEKRKRAKYLEKDEKEKVAAGVNKATLVDSFLEGALAYLEQHQVAKAIDIMQGIVLYVAQSDEIKDKAATAEEMIQGALTYLQEDKLEKGTEMIREAAKYLENDEDYKAAIGKGKGAKYLEKGNAEKGILKAHFVEEVLKGAMSYLQENHLVKAKDVIQGVQQFIAQDNTLKDKRATAEQLLNGAFGYLEQEKSGKAQKIIQEAIEYLQNDEDVKEANKVFKEAEAKEAKLRGVKYLEKDEKEKVAAGVNKATLVDSFLEGALAYLEQHQVAKAIDIMQGIVLYVAQSDEIKDKAAVAEEMIQGALTYLQEDKLEKGTEMIREAAKCLENDEDYKAAIGKGKGAKYLEKGNAEKGILKAHFVEEVLKGAMSYLQENHLVKAKDVIQGVQQFIAQDNTLKDKRATAEQLLNGAFGYLEQEKSGKAQKIIQEAIEYLQNDEDVKEANKVFKEAEAKEAKLRGVKYLEKDEKEKGIVLYVAQSDEIKDKAAAAEEMIQGALTYLQEDKLEKGTEMIREAAKCLENDEDYKAAIGKGKGAKYLEKGNAEKGILKAHFVEEVLKGAMSYLQANHLVKAKDVIQGVQQFIAQDNTLKDKRATAEQLLNGAFGYLEQEKSGKAQKIIQEAIEYLQTTRMSKKQIKSLKKQKLRKLS